MPEPRILFVDIETAPIKGYTWELFDTNVMHVEQPTFMLSYAYKWADKKTVWTAALCDYPGYKKDLSNDAALVTGLHELMASADIIIAHNGDSFDIKKSNARFIVHGLPPLPPFKTVDTLKVARRYFRFDSNKLDNIGRYLQVGRKMPHTGKDLWLGCMAGDPKSWATMRRYNAQDVRLLEAVYLKLKSWHTGHPDLRAYTGRTGCPTCQSQHVQCRGVNTNKTRQTQRMHCLSCRRWYQGPVIKDEGRGHETEGKRKAKARA